MMTDDRATAAAILTKAATVEARRQQAALAGDEIAETAALLELAQLREAYRAKCPFLTAKR